MGIIESLAQQGKKLIESGPLARVVSDDRFMRVATGVMDARSRFGTAKELAGQALDVLLNGYEAPTIDPAQDDDAGVVEAPKRAASTAGAAPVNGAGHLSAPPSNDAPSAPRQPRAAAQGAEAELATQMASRASLARVGGKDVFTKCQKFTTADNARAMGLYPFFRPLDFNNGPEAQLDGKKVVMLGSNNYLGLTTHPKVREAARAAIDKYGTSMTGSRLVNGTMRLHKELEDKLAASRQGGRPRLHRRLPGEHRRRSRRCSATRRASRSSTARTTRASTTASASLKRPALAWPATSTTTPPPSTRPSRSWAKARARSSSPTACSARRARSPTCLASSRS
jgi:hypothetical protein